MSKYEYFYIEEISNLRGKENSELLMLFLSNNDFISFAFIEENLQYESEENRKFLLSNQLCISDKWIFPPRPAFLEPIEILWFRTTDMESILKALSLESLFRCIILSEGQPIEQASYIFYIIEGDDGQELWIEAKSGDDFRTRVLPEIKRLYKSVKVLGWDKDGSELITL